MLQIARKGELLIEIRADKLSPDPEKSKYKIIVKKGSIRNPVYIPELLCDTFIWVVHADGHFGITKTTQLLTGRVWWPSLPGDVANTLRTCLICLEKFKINPHVGVPVDRSVQEPGQLLCMDLVGPVVTSPDAVYKYILVAVDSYSKFTFMEPLKKKTGLEVAQTLLDRVFLLTGVPEQIYTDAGLEFSNQVTRKLFQALKCTVKVSAPYHHQSNLAERTI